jgi:peptidoglycan/xylan/chitin deacetylase (PgdA/CDA1 family)
MSDGDGLRAKLERRAARVMHSKTIPMRNEVGVVSFSFDDIPRSACLAGRKVLESHDAQGTFYACGGLTDQPREGDADGFHSRDDLKSLAGAGHELGCHGFGHISYQTHGEATLRTDFEHNREFFTDLGCDMPPRNFAYPFGHVSPRAKAIAANSYVTARGVQPGVHVGSVDLALLKATPLYESTITEDQVANLIARTERDKGWLIFFTHGVTHSPDRWGCSPGLLDFAVRTASQSTCRVLSVVHALGHVAFRPE